jgi:hypothetical protein
LPPDLASRGLSGEVVASQLLDKLARMQAETNSIRPAGTYRNNWGDDIKVEIPDTGISIGELNRYLRHWLGRETHITGEIYRVPAGIALTARARDAGTTFTGKETDFDNLLQKAAEAIYAETQPYRYAAFLDQMGRIPEAMPVLKRLATDAAPAERAWPILCSAISTRFMAVRETHLRRCARAWRRILPTPMPWIISPMTSNRWNILKTLITTRRRRFFSTTGARSLSMWHGSRSSSCRTGHFWREHSVIT